MKFLAIALLFIVMSTSPARAEVFGKKQEAKEQKRWTLGDWLAQKRSMRAQDLWLGFHKPSPYEFFFGGTYQSGDRNGDYYHSWWGHAAVYAYFLGAQYQREFNLDSQRNIGLLHLRVFGIYQQSTNITFEGGAKYEVRNGATLWNPLAGVAFTLYLNRFLGIEGLYRYYFPTDVPALGGRIAGTRYEATGFAEFRWLRLFAGYGYEIESNASGSDSIQKGAFGGLRLYF